MIVVVAELGVTESWAATSAAAEARTLKQEVFIVVVFVGNNSRLSPFVVNREGLGKKTDERKFDR